MILKKSFSVVVADEEPVSRHGLVSLLKSRGVVAQGEAGCARSARELCEKHQPEVLVMDVTLRDGYYLIKDLPQVSERTRVVVLSGLTDPGSLQRAFQAGARGYVSKRDSLASVVQVICKVAEGERALGPFAEGIFLESLASGGISVQTDEMEGLTNRELQVFRLLGKGLGTREMADELRLSKKTVESHRQRIKEKLRLTSGAELQRRAVLYAGARG